MTDYLITWKIDIEASTPQKAAAIALLIQRDPNSMATAFEITNKETNETTTIDFEPCTCDESLEEHYHCITCDHILTHYEHLIGHSCTP